MYWLRVQIETRVVFLCLELFFYMCLTSFILITSCSDSCLSGNYTTTKQVYLTFPSFPLKKSFGKKGELLYQKSSERIFEKSSQILAR